MIKITKNGTTRNLANPYLPDFLNLFSIKIPIPNPINPTAKLTSATIKSPPTSSKLARVSKFIEPLNQREASVINSMLHISAKRIHATILDLALINWPYIIIVRNSVKILCFKEWKHIM